VSLNPLLAGKAEVLTRSLVTPKHPGAISVVNYKGGVGKTTVSCLLGYYLAQDAPKSKVLLFDIDPQCSLSLALGFDPNEVNKTLLTQAMLRACSYYVAVTIPDAISIYGMPRLLRWVMRIPGGERPLLLGYVLNALNRHGGGMVVSQQAAEADLLRNIGRDLE